MCGGTDIIEQRTYLKYCNGAETFYSYDPARRRLQNLVVNAKAGTIMDNAYTYDAVSNVLSVKNGAPLPQSGKAGGQMSHSYTYDPLYRLASATGTYKGTDNKAASYTLSMGYDNMHRITSKKQHLSQTGVQFDGTLNAGYELAYTYGSAEGKKFQLDNVRDINYRTEETPTDSTNINNGHKYTYDANGNLVYINTSRVKKDGKEDEKASEQKYRWDEENRLLAVDENGFVSNYWYDADGERTVKTSGENEAIYVNSEFSGGNTGTARFSLYVSPYLVAGQGGKYTKHIYVGSQRIVSKLGDLASYGADPRRIPYAGNEADGLTINYKDKYNQQLQSIKDNYKAFDQPYNGKDNDDYVNGQGFCCNDGTPEAAQARVRTRAASGNFKPNDDYEKMQFYYHPDHLGSSSYITNLDGEVSQHIEYVPFGEVFIEERNNTWNTPYLFNAKEFDEETGMYYYGARYYEPRLSLWISTDPLEEESPIITTYGFCHNNPLILIDPDGMGDYFNEKGVWLGSDGMNDKKVYSAQSVTKSKRGLVNDAKDAKLLGISYDKFVWQASAVYGESSAYLVRNKTDEPSDEMMKEMYAIASVHQRNSKAYGVTSDPAKDFRKKNENQRNELPLMRTAIAAEINALLGGRDYSNGATMWDGAEQAQFSLDDTRRSTGRFEIHMNTMGWKISNEHYAKWKKNVGKSFKAPQTRVAPMYLSGEKKRNMNAGKTRLKSTAVYGRTIFWKETK